MNSSICTQAYGIQECHYTASTLQCNSCQNRPSLPLKKLGFIVQKRTKSLPELWVVFFFVHPDYLTLVLFSHSYDVSPEEHTLMVNLSMTFLCGKT